MVLCLVVEPSNLSTRMFSSMNPPPKRPFEQESPPSDETPTDQSSWTYSPFIKLSSPKTPFVAVQRDGLRKRLNEMKSTDDYVPFNLRAKINVVLGGTNFPTDVFNLTDPKDLADTTVVGAHIRQPISGKTTYCPAIATVVASISGDAVQYPGSYRVQSTFTGPARWVKGVPISGIHDLKHMMNNRFITWLAENSMRFPRFVVFYRDGIRFDDHEVIAWEIQAIKDAFDKWGKEEPQVHITYVVVNKNAQISPVIPTDIFKFDFGIGPESDEADKLQYYVMHNQIGFTRAQLIELVSIHAMYSTYIHIFANTIPDSEPQQELAALFASRSDRQDLAAAIRDAFYADFVNLPEKTFVIDDTDGMSSRKYKAVTTVRKMLDQDQKGGDFERDPAQTHHMWYI